LISSLGHRGSSTGDGAEEGTQVGGRKRGVFKVSGTIRERHWGGRGKIEQAAYLVVAQRAGGIVHEYLGNEGEGPKSERSSVKRNKTRRSWGGGTS